MLNDHSTFTPTNLKVVHYVEKPGAAEIRIRKDEMWTDVSTRTFNVTLTDDMVDTPLEYEIPRNSSLLDLAGQADLLEFQSIPAEALTSENHSPLLERAQLHVIAHTDKILHHAREQLQREVPGDPSIVGPCFNSHDTHADICLSENNSVVKRRGVGVYRSSRCNCAIPLTGEPIYFEVTILHLDTSDPQCGACIGLSSPSFPLQNHLTGFSEDSVGLFSLGYVVHKNDFTEFGRPFDNGDTIGCLVCAHQNSTGIELAVTFNMNSTVLDTLTYHFPRNVELLYPTVSVMGNGASVQGRFTSDSFVFKDLLNDTVHTITGQPISAPNSHEPPDDSSDEVEDSS